MPRPAANYPNHFVSIAESVLEQLDSDTLSWIGERCGYAEERLRGKRTADARSFRIELQQQRERIDRIMNRRLGIKL